MQARLVTHIVIVAIFTLLSIGSAIANKSVDSNSTLQLSSAYFSQKRTVHIVLPPSYEQGNTGYPVLYLTDGQSNLEHTASAARFLAQQHKIPELIIVAIETNEHRTRDLTPSYRKGSLAVLGHFAGPTRQQNPGGAEMLLQFIDKELIPYVDKHYRTSGYRALAGHSFGGLFATYALLEKPDLFNGVMLASPSLWWDKERLLNDLLAKALINKCIYISMADESAIITQPFQRLNDAWRKPNGIDFKAQHFSGESHMSVVYPSYYHGLQHLFNHYQPSLKVAAAGVTQLENHVAIAKSLYGLKTYPYDALTSLGYGALFERNFTAAINLFSFVSQHNSASLNALQQLAMAYQQKGDKPSLLKTYQAMLKLEGLSESEQKHLLSEIKALQHLH
ncbi:MULTISPECIES: alpha/beta hydrolase [unclassified Pseudoalteromonas]|uniref:alpha/beta hydrolase n=1 Tax=unclassified Pseudoalteromonas TaxID=194690 RepID=UPI001EEB7E16|nr:MULTISPECIES: alpha/beta hydrolase-fold protein [unclassified Pseudoalteromonas]MCF2829193.1 alpha/beta hydrolase [Pseudoalteromonas sp. OF5H-5]MCF2829847.1 alpha/beta hydrolase [Pseudoalteromonas sp. DL2-H6]MCF2926657.1 alpha/beta hydrolase [Pseudoalteromonas sp. DL2-H1]MCG7554761.1 alpha/beta hydrolase [Pseudoalteromonas sp. Of11M-6]